MKERARHFAVHFKSRKAKNGSKYIDESDQFLKVEKGDVTLADRFLS